MTDTTSTENAPETPEETEEATTTPEAPEQAGDGNDAPEEEAGQTFTAEYVRKLREEAAAQRVKAKRADDLAQEVFRLRVAATGRLADPTDLAYDEALLEDEEALSGAIDDLLTARPHYAARRAAGSVGQGATGSSGGVDLAGILRARA